MPEQLLEPKQLSETLNIAQIHDALILGIRDYFTKMGFSKAIVGSSGGIDSAVVIALACTALGCENVRAILMPSPYSTVHSVSDAEKLSKNNGNPYAIIPIKNIYEDFLKELKPIFKDLPFSIAEENIQSRVRGNLSLSFWPGRNSAEGALFIMLFGIISLSLFIYFASSYICSL